MKNNKHFFGNLFRKTESEQEKRINAEMAYRNQERSFRRYDADLDKSITKFENMAVEAMSNGQKSNALCAARFVSKMKAIKEKVASVRQHFEMLHSLSTVSDIMVQFMDNCNSLGCNLREQIDIRTLTESQIGMETGLNKLSFITECVEQAFEQIESGLDIGSLSDPVGNEESEAMLDDILQRHGAAVPAAPVTAGIPAVSAAAVTTAAEIPVLPHTESPAPAAETAPAVTEPRTPAMTPTFADQFRRMEVS